MFLKLGERFFNVDQIVEVDPLDDGSVSVRTANGAEHTFEGVDAQALRVYFGVTCHNPPGNGELFRARVADTAQVLR